MGCGVDVRLRFQQTLSLLRIKAGDQLLLFRLFLHWFVTFGETNQSIWPSLVVAADPVAVDLFDPAAVSDTVAGHDAVMHFATSIPSQQDMPRRRAWDTNDRLRSETTGFLVDAAIEHGVGLFVQESITFPYADAGSAWIDETSPLGPVWDVLDSALVAEEHVARFRAAGGRGVTLRFSALYGPGRTSETLVQTIAARKMPVVGAGVNYVSRVHVADAGAAIAAAVDVAAGVYNITDDEPLTAAEELLTAAKAVGAKPPRRIPKLLARMVAGNATSILTVSHRVSNERFKGASGWSPTYASVREGWPAVVASRWRVDDSVTR